MECLCDKEILEKHGCTSILRGEDGKVMCNSPCVKRIVAERDEMRMQMLEELGRADLLEERVNGQEMKSKNCELYSNREDAFSAYIGTFTKDELYDYEHGAGDFDDQYNVLQRFIDWLYEPVKKGG